MEYDVREMKNPSPRRIINEFNEQKKEWKSNATSFLLYTLNQKKINFRLFYIINSLNNFGRFTIQKVHKRKLIFQSPKAHETVADWCFSIRCFNSSSQPSNLANFMQPSSQLLWWKTSLKEFFLQKLKQGKCGIRIILRIWEKCNNLQFIKSVLTIINECSTRDSLSNIYYVVKNKSFL